MPRIDTEFADDFASMIATIKATAAKHDLPLPTLVFPPEWQGAIRYAPNVMSYNAQNNQIFMGVRFEFGQLRSVKAMMVECA